jgi:hypothetical protein
MISKGEIHSNAQQDDRLCRERNELDLSKYEFDLILDEIKEVLTGQQTLSFLEGGRYLLLIAHAIVIKINMEAE